LYEKKRQKELPEGTLEPLSIFEKIGVSGSYRTKCTVEREREIERELKNRRGNSASHNGVNTRLTDGGRCELSNSGKE